MTEDQKETSEPITATVKWFNKDKGYGFISLPGGGLDVFVHAKQLRLSGIERVLNEGEKVSFNVRRGPKGVYATEISVVSDTPTDNA